MEKLIQNDIFKISVPTWNGKFELLDGLYSVSDIYTCFENIIKRHETVTGNWKNEKKTKKTGCYLAFLIPETMKLL